LLGTLPATLRGYSRSGAATCIVVLLDQDDDDCVALLGSLKQMLANLAKRPALVLFRIAMEEIEAWFIADRKAVRAAYPGANFKGVSRSKPDLIDDPSDVLARCLGEPLPCTGQMKAAWAKNIAPLIDLDRPKSPSLRKFIEGIGRHWQMT
jgi:hypothetical protein